jgi:hypothetical protein
VAQVTAQELSLRRWGTEMDPEEVAENAHEVAVRNRKKRKRYNENKKALLIASSLVAQFDRADATVGKGGDGNNGHDEGTSTPVMKKMTEAHADATGIVAEVEDFERESVEQFDRADATVNEGGDGNYGRDDGTSTPAMKKTTEAHADATGIVAGVEDFERESVEQFDRADATVNKGGDGNYGCDEGTSTPAMKKMTEAHADATGIVAGVEDFERESVACKLMAAIEMVANAKHAALKAVTDYVEVLTAQVEWLKSELSDAVARMERSTEDGECIGGGLKRWSKEEGSDKRQRG